MTDRSHYDKQICSGEMVEKVKQNGSCAVERGRMEEMQADAGGLLATRDHDNAWAMLLSRTMSGSMVLLQLGFEWTAMAHVATKDCNDALYLVCPLWPCRCLRTTTGATLI